MPYSLSVRSAGAVVGILYSDELASAIELTNQQRDAIELASKELGNTMSSVVNGKFSVSEIRNSVELASNQTRDKLHSILNAKQQRLLFQHKALKELESDLPATWRRREVIKHRDDWFIVSIATQNQPKSQPGSASFVGFQKYKGEPKSFA